MKLPAVCISIGRLTFRMDLTVEPSDREQAIAEIDALHTRLGGSTALVAELDGQDDSGELKAARLRHPSQFGFGPSGFLGGHSV